MSKKKEEAARQEEINQEIMRMKLPCGNQVFGLLDQRLGASRANVRCLDGKVRVCRIPGRLKRKLWVRPGDFVIIEPWEFGGDEKGDIIYKYKPIQVNWLKHKGYLKELDSLADF